ncbi:SH3 domain-containing protein [Clostridium paraputrificum]|uniref:SH3 domain-containing protein n=1 Tax=Clostridium paraputrificum TaxID=29363 RepID=UPI003D3417C9
MTKVMKEVNGISITKNLIGINYTKGIFIKPKYIVVHDIVDERFTTMREYRNYIARDSGAKVSTHYLVGARAIIKILEDDWRGWHVGDGPSKEITNSNSIAVAMFVRDRKDVARTIQNTVELINSLREKYDISIKNVKRHYDVTGKRCPKLLMENEVWSRFQLALKGIYQELIPRGRGKIIGVLSSLNLKKEPKDDSEVIGKIKSEDSFYIYAEFGGWVKTTYETEEKIVVGYLSKDYVEVLPLEDKKKDKDQTIVEKEIDEIEALDQIRKLYKKPSETYNAVAELEKLIASEEKKVEGIITKAKVETNVDKPVYSPIERREMNNDGVVVNVDTNLGVRRGPGEEHFVIGYLLAAQKVKVTQEIGDWYKIIYQSSIGRRIGFIEKTFIKLI